MMFFPFTHLERFAMFRRRPDPDPQTVETLRLEDVLLGKLDQAKDAPDTVTVYSDLGKAVGDARVLDDGRIEMTITDPDLIDAVRGPNTRGLSVDIDIGGPDAGFSAPFVPMYDLAAANLRRSPARVIKDTASMTPDVVIDALEAEGYQIVPSMPHLDGDDAECGHANPVWFAPNELWNEVMDPDDDRAAILCPACFVAEAAKRGVEGVWELNLVHRRTPPAWMQGRGVEFAAAFAGRVKDSSGDIWELLDWPLQHASSKWARAGDVESWATINREHGPITVDDD